MKDFANLFMPNICHLIIPNRSLLILIVKVQLSELCEFRWEYPEPDNKS